MRQQLRLGKQRAHGGAELRLAVVGQDHVLHQHGLVIGNAQLLCRVGHLLGAHHQMAQQLPTGGITGHQAQLGEGKFLGLGEIVQQRARQQQVAVDDGAVLIGQKVRHGQHIHRVHQQTPEKTMVDAFGGGDLLKVRQMPPQQLPAKALIVRVPYAVHHVIDLLQIHVGVDGSHGNQCAQVYRVVLCAQADAVNDDLRTAPVFRHRAPQLDDLSLVAAADGARIVPHLGLDDAGSVGQRRAEKGFARRRGLGVSALQNVKALYGVAAAHIGDFFVVFHMSIVLSGEVILDCGGQPRSL